jgi:glycosyltransferase involved in cell wall biosynthesis
MNSNRKVFVFNGYDIYGGSYMLYQLGLICYECFGFQVFIVQNHHKKRGKSRFQYKYDFPTLSIYNMRRLIRNQDLFICNPVQSRHGFGSLLSAQKLMYLQGISNYSKLDHKFDSYVSASSFIQNHTKSRYRIDTPVISPYVDLSLFSNDAPWNDRSDEILILNYKTDPQPLLDSILECYKAKYGNKIPNFKIIGGINQEEWANVLKNHKFFLNVSPIEGFGLPPLEAMACGCVVLGLDSYGGRDYFETGRNALVVPENDVEQLTDYLYEMVSDPNKGANISTNAVTTAKNYSYSNFKENWRNFLEATIFKSE